MLELLTRSPSTRAGEKYCGQGGNSRCVCVCFLTLCKIGKKIPWQHATRQFTHRGFATAESIEGTLSTGHGGKRTPAGCSGKWQAQQTERRRCSASS